MDEANVRLILSDSFGEQVATPFKEGTVETENEVDFEEHLGYLCDIWEYWLARKGWELQNWFLKYKEHKMKKMHDNVGESTFMYQYSTEAISE